MIPAAKTPLARALLAELGTAEMVVAQSREWLSATFAGHHHRLGLVTTAEAGDRLARLPPEALRVAGEVVADLRVVAAVPAGGTVRLTLEALTVRSC